MATDISQDKKLALKQVLQWCASKERREFLTLGGYAGTGKTTLIALLRQILFKQDPKFKVAFAAFTGKAARVLQGYLQQHKVLYKGDSVSTIHGLIYSVIENERHEIIGWQKKEQLKADLIIIDEASMIDQKIWLDLLSYDIPVLAVGDHGQLPPVQGSFNLMEAPQLRLEKIHRQAQDNPIIKLSIQARQTGQIAVGRYSDKVRKFSRHDPEAMELLESYLTTFSAETLVLCGYNNTRVKLNNYARGLLGFESPLPSSGDRVICLRNNQQKALFNGMLGQIAWIKNAGEHFYELKVTWDDGADFEGLAVKKQFGANTALNWSPATRQLTLKADLFDFAYALTVHKAQGSQARRVILFEERFKQMSDQDWRRWLYTAVTRAEEELLILGD